VDVLSTGPGRSAALQLFGLNVIARLLVPVAFRGWTRAAELLARPFPKGNHALVSVRGDARLKIYLGDYYWARYAVDGGVPYEPELEFVLGHALDEDSVFLDCGANIGHWSAFASTIVTRPDHVVAIEPDPHAFALLAENRELNGDSFVAVEAAIGSSSGETVDFAFKRGRHVASHALPVGQAAPEGWSVSPVTTLSVDDALARLEDAEGRPVVVKLDVEGAEIAALVGATETLARDPIVVYEDQGGDRQCVVSAYLMNDLGLRVFAIESDRLRAMRSPADVGAVKTDKHVGYNFVALSATSRWRERFGVVEVEATG
jgi:FkbM family methyltransferase